jgi:sulfite reductase alpha subunit-like flavoprotein
MALPRDLLPRLILLLSRVRALAVDADAATADHSFAERAENYYHKRPQLLVLHHSYLYLAERYAQTLHANKQQHHATAHAVSDCSSSDVDDRCSDADSSLSFQHSQQPPPQPPDEDPELVVAELVLA